MIKPNEIPIALMRQRLRYENGKLFWIDGMRAGKEAGYLMPDGYKRLAFGGKGYPTHRIIYSLSKGKIPDGMVIDHINQKKDDNRIENLRAVSHSENSKNIGLQSNNTSGVNGVRLDKKTQKYKTYIIINGKNKHLGYYNTIDEAKKARLAAEIKYANIKPITPTFSEHKVKKINIKELREQFDYKEGFLIRKTGRNAGKPITGSKSTYSLIMFDGKAYAAHRLIYAWHNGKIADGRVIDHIDGNKKNNKIENLRAVTKSQNSQNSKLQSNNISGIRGVHFNNERQKWVATIYKNKKLKSLGRYTTKQDAIKARKRAEVEQKYLTNVKSCV